MVGAAEQPSDHRHIPVLLDRITGISAVPGRVSSTQLRRVWHHPGVPENGCRLSVHDDGKIREAMLDGSPAALRALAGLLDASDASVQIELAEGLGCVRRQHTTDDRLRVSVEPGPTLLIEGTAKAIGIVTSTMRGLADEADEVRSAAVSRHAHIEYLGEDDRWRAPDTFPLVIGSDWPDEAV